MAGESRSRREAELEAEVLSLQAQIDEMEFEQMSRHPVIEQPSPLERWDGVERVEVRHAPRQEPAPAPREVRADKSRLRHEDGQRYQAELAKQYREQGIIR